MNNTSKENNKSATLKEASNEENNTYLIFGFISLLFVFIFIFGFMFMFLSHIKDGGSYNEYGFNKIEEPKSFVIFPALVDNKINNRQHNNVLFTEYLSLNNAMSNIDKAEKNNHLKRKEEIAFSTTSIRSKVYVL